MGGLEPPASCAQDTHSAKLSYIQVWSSQLDLNQHPCDPNAVPYQIGPWPDEASAPCRWTIGPWRAGPELNRRL